MKATFASLGLLPWVVAFARRSSLAVGHGFCLLAVACGF